MRVRISRDSLVFRFNIFSVTFVFASTQTLTIVVAPGTYGLRFLETSCASVAAPTVSTISKIAHFCALYRAAFVTIDRRGRGRWLERL